MGNQLDFNPDYLSIVENSFSFPGLFFIAKTPDYHGNQHMDLDIYQIKRNFHKLRVVITKFFVSLTATYSLNSPLASLLLLLYYGNIAFFKTVLACVADLIYVGCPAKSPSSLDNKNLFTWSTLTGKFILNNANNSFIVVYCLFLALLR